MTGRSFKSCWAALGYACAVKGHAAGPASLAAARGGRPPDHALATDVFACLARAGLDPHDASPVLAAVKAWATSLELDLDEQTAGKLDAALRRIASELVDAGLVDPSRPVLAPVSWRAIELEGRIHYHACADGEAGHADLGELKAAICRGILAPEQAVRCPTAREMLLQRLAVDHAADRVTTTGIDDAIMDALGLQRSRARQIRRVEMGIVAKRGDRRRFFGEKTN